MILCDQVDCGERASGLVGKLENRQMSFHGLGKNSMAFAFEFWGGSLCRATGAWMPAESTRSGRGRASISLLR